jgi:hypothetical protein
VAFDAIDLQFNGKNRSEESEQKNAVKEQDPGSKETKLAEASLDT